MTDTSARGQAPSKLSTNSSKRCETLIWIPPQHMQIPEPLNSRFLVLSGCRVHNPISDSPCVAKILLGFPGEFFFFF